MNTLTSFLKFSENKFLNLPKEAKSKTVSNDQTFKLIKNQKTPQKIQTNLKNEDSPFMIRTNASATTAHSSSNNNINSK